jgi:hypothetical protein
MRNAFTQSILFHVVIVAISYFGLPYISRTATITDTPIMVEIVNVDELTNAPPPKPRPEKKPEPMARKAAPPKPPKAATPPPPPAKEKEVAMTVPDMKAKKKEPKPEAKAPEKPQPQLANVKPKRKPKPPDQFTSVLKTVEKLKAQPKEKEKDKEKVKEKPESFEQQMAKALTSRTAEHNPMRPLAISEIDLVRQQIRECWNLPAGAKDAQDLNIEIRVVMNPDATVREARIQDQRRLQGDPFFRAAAESALRAVLNPRCNPLKLPPDKYQQWQTMTLNFDPRDMF